MAVVNRARRFLVLGAVTTAVTGLAAGPALAAASTWSVEPGGAVTAKSGTVVLTDTTIPCSAVIDGTSVTADNGKVKVTYRNSTGKLTVLMTGGKLVFYKSNCPGIASGDRATLSAFAPVTPRQTITSP